MEEELAVPTNCEVISLIKFHYAFGGTITMVCGCTTYHFPSIISLLPYQSDLRTFLNFGIFYFLYPRLNFFNFFYFM